MTETQLPEADPQPVDSAWLARLHSVRPVETDATATTRQPDAADHIWTLLADGDLKAGRNELSERDIADVHAVLAQHADMARRLANLRIEWSPRNAEGSFYEKQYALDAAAERYGNGPVDDDEVAWRLVGRWRDADEYQAEGNPA